MSIHCTFVFKADRNYDSRISRDL